MSLITLSSREFNQDTARAKRAAAKGPVVITDRGVPAHVLLSFERYLALTRSRGDIVEMLSLAEAANIEFDAPKAEIRARASEL